MIAKHGIELTAEETQFAYEALLYFSSNLHTHKSWLHDQALKPLPGTEIALVEIEEELGKLRALQMKIYKTSFKLT